MGLRALSALREVILVENKDLRMEKFQDWKETHLIEIRSVGRISAEALRWYTLDMDEARHLEKKMLFDMLVKELLKSDALHTEETLEKSGALNLCARLLVLKDLQDA